MGTHIHDKFPPTYDFGGAKVLNLGCGFGKFSASNVVNLDAFDVCNPDVVWDLNKTPLPFEDEAFDYIIANHILEHVHNWWECFNDLSRVLKTLGKMDVWVPGSGSDSIRGFRDHLHEINHCSFFGVHGTYAKGSNAWADEHAYCWANRIVLVERMCNIRNDWWIHYAPKSVKQWMSEHLRNVAIEQGYRFQKITVEAYEKEQEKARESRKNGHPNLIRNPIIPV